MVRSGCFHSLLTLAVLTAGGAEAVCAAHLPFRLPFARLTVMALGAWGLLSLPVGLLVAHYCALGDEPGR